MSETRRSHSWRPSDVIMAGLCLLTVACATPVIPSGSPTSSPKAKGSAPAAELSSFEQVGRNELKSALAGFTPESVSAAFLSDTLGAHGLPFRLLGPKVEHAAVGVIHRHCERLVQEGVPQSHFALVDVSAARADYAFIQTKLELASSLEARKRLYRQLRARGVALELHAWRLAGQVFSLATPADRERLGGWDSFKRAILQEPEEALASLLPPVPGYHALLALLRLYDANSAIRSRLFEPEWASLVPGDKGVLVVQLRTRLKLEGLRAKATGKESHWGEGLSVALRKYQARFSLQQTGRVDGETQEVMSVSFRERAQQIREVLRHMETAPYYRTPTRVVVNIPAFTLQHFEGGRLVANHRVVVGAISKDKQGKIDRAGRINETPRLAGKITAIVLNPSWHVPPRIKRELDGLAARNPSIYDTFRIYTDDEGRERAVQPPSPYSALGKVKLAFPNSQAIFLHDTPRTELFQERVRAFSHGCVRVENAVSLAKSLLDRDPNTLGAAKADALLRSNFETPIKLTHAVPVFIEYVTIDVAPNGAVRFYPDVYGIGAVAPAREEP